MSKELEEELARINKPISLRKVRAIDFFDALKEEDYSIVSESQEEFERLLNAYEKLTSEEDAKSGLAENFDRRILIFTTAYNLLRNFGWVEEQKEVLAKFKFKISEETLDADLIRLKNTIDRIKMEYENFKKATKGEGKENKPKSNKRLDTYTIFARLEVSLGFSFDYETISLAKIAGLTVALREKIQAETPNDDKKHN